MSAERDLERESLEAIYGEDFVALGESEWRVSLAAGAAWLRVSLPADYPHSAPAPEVGSASFDSLPPGAARELEAQLLQQFSPGEGCVYGWCEVVEDALRAFEAAGRGPAAAEGAAEPPEERPGGAAEQAARRVPVEPAAAEQVRASLRAAAFSEYPGGLFAHLDRGVTVSVGDSLEVTVDGIESEDLADWSLLQLEQDPAVFGEGLLEWATAQRSEQPGFAEGGEGDVVAGDFADFLPDPAALSVQQHRDLTIYTWGKAFRKVAPADSQANFNAGILNGRGGGADIRVDNGLTEAVQKNVASCALFPRWLEMCINKIESEGLHAVSINCTKGRHRSVAAAEILRAYYYPDAVVIHTSPAIKR